MFIILNRKNHTLRYSKLFTYTDTLVVVLVVLGQCLINGLQETSRLGYQPHRGFHHSPLKEVP